MSEAVRGRGEGPPCAWARTMDSTEYSAPCGIPEPSLASAIIDFGRLLKAAGFFVSTPSIMDALTGAACVGVDDLETFRSVLKATFMTTVEQSVTFDRLFDEFWLTRGNESGEDSGAGSQPESDAADPSHAFFAAGSGLAEFQQGGAGQPYIVYSPQETVRDQDFGTLSHAHDERIVKLIRELLAPLLRRAGVRPRPFSHGAALDFRKILGRSVRYGGEIFELPRLRPRRRVKRLVFLCDVSGSMNPYLQFMLRFIRELQDLPTRVETWVFATRLHRITPLMQRYPFARAMREVERTVKDWSGGTRIGACFQQFTTYRGGAMLSPSTVVLIHSDGWDRGETVLLEREMALIHRRVYRVIWINPLLGGASYEPTCRGMRAALPHVDSFIPGHNIAGLERLVGTLRGLL